MQQVRDHLHAGGVFVQWMNVSFLDEDLLRSLAATLLDVFAQVRLYRPEPSTLVFLGSDDPLELEETVARSGTPLARSPRHYARFGIHAPEDIVVALVADQAGVEALARGAPLITDDMNRMATDDVYDRGFALSVAQLSRILDAYDPLQRPKSSIHTGLASQLSYAYMARRMALFTAIDASIPKRIGRMAQLLNDPSMSAYAQGIAIANAGDVRAAQRLFHESLALDPRNDAARYEYVRPWLAALAKGQAPADVVTEAARLEGPPAAVIQARRHAVAGEWEQLPALDPLLATASETDPWYVECVQMRVDWRTRVTNPEHRARLGREALAMVEEVVVSQPSAAMFALRARSAIAADRPDVLLESIFGYAQSTVSNLSRLRDEDAPALSGTLDTLLKAIDEVGNDTRVQRVRVQQVRDEVVAASGQIRSRTPASGAR
jgi:hypothetical protein